MQDIELYRQILGISSPWKVARVDLNIENMSVYVYAVADSIVTEWDCPECSRVCRIYDHRAERTWRHLDSCQFKTFLVASLPRVSCPDHGVRTVIVPWSEPNSRFTSMFERFAIDVLRATKVQVQAGKILRLSSGQIHDLMSRAVVRGLERRDKDELLRHLSVDEKSFQKGHQYVTVLSDPKGKRVLDVVEGRTKEAVKLLFTESLTPKQRMAVRTVSMDMWPAFMTSREEVFPQAETVHDRFHVIAYLNEAVDKTRRTEQKTLRIHNDTILIHTKYLWLKSDENMTETQKMNFAKLSGLDLETAKVWAFKDNFHQFFKSHTRFGGMLFFKRWREAARVLNNPHLNKVAEMLARHLVGLLAYIEHRVSNGIAEGFNSQIQLIKSNARGYRKFENFRVAILFFLGKMSMYPLKTP